MFEITKRALIRNAKPTKSYVLVDKKTKQILFSSNANIEFRNVETEEFVFEGTLLFHTKFKVLEVNNSNKGGMNIKIELMGNHVERLGIKEITLVGKSCELLVYGLAWRDLNVNSDNLITGNFTFTKKGLSYQLSLLPPHISYVSVTDKQKLQDLKDFEEYLLIKE